MIKTYFKYIILFILVSFCGLNQNDIQTIVDTNNEKIEEVTTTSLNTGTTTTTSTPTTTIPACIPDSNVNIDFENILNIQKFLNKYGFEAGEPDGYFGQESADAVRRFQAFAGLNPDGDVGPKTIEKMQSWTGCEEQVDVYISETIDTTTTTVVPDNYYMVYITCG